MNAHIPLLAAQEGVWIGQALDPDSDAYVTAESVELVGAIDSEALLAATSQALREADGLRARIASSAHTPFQELVADLSVEPAMVEVADPAAARAFMSADTRLRFDLQKGPLARQALVRCATGQLYWYLAAHHVALDGYGFSLILQRAAELYSARVQRRPATASRFASLREAVEEDQRYRASSEHTQDRAFWLARLHDMPATLSPAGRVPKVAERPRRVVLDVDGETLAALDLSLQRRGPSWLHTLTALFAGFVADETGAEEVVLGLPVLARKGKLALRTPAMMMNIVPLRLSSGRGQTVRACAEAASRELAALLPHSQYRHEQLRRDLGRLGGERRLFGPVLNIMPFARSLALGLATGTVQGIAAGPVEDLSLSVHPLPARAGLRLTFDAHPDSYSEQLLQGLAERFVERTAARARNVEQLMGALPARTSGDVLLHGPALAQPACDVLHEILAHAHERGEQVAVEEQGRTTTYRELLLRAHGLAQALAERGIGEGSLVALYLPRSTDAIVAMLAVLLRNAAYLPLDPAGPAERCAAILADARPALMLVVSEAVDVLHPQLCMSELAPARTLPSLGSYRGDARAYVIYTSGSTGVPNGVQISRSALAHFVAAARTRYGLRGEDRLLQFAPLAFDASVEEIFLPLTSGAQLVLRSDDMIDSAAHFLRQSAALAISVLGLPTAFFHELVYAVRHAGLRFPDSLRTIIIGGEAALAARARELHAATGGTVRLLNTYGPTETTVVAIAADLTADVGADLPIGLPLPGIRVLLRPRAGAAGIHELYVLGPTLAAGYLGKPELTAQRFVTLAEHGRAYRTGDLVRVRDDGQLSFAGREDDQLKISGHRVELGEVEDVLRGHPGVRDVVVVVKNAAARARLVAHLVASETLSLDALREHARRLLLAAAVPASFRVHDKLPLTATGKVDRKLLSDLEDERAQDDEPSSELERLVREVFLEVLGTPHVGLDQDFFELGGQSLQSIQAASRLSVRLGRELAGATLFRNPTVRSLARALGEDSPSSVRDEHAALLADAQLAALGPAGVGSGSDVLLTGATGFLGAQLLHRLLAEGHGVVCIVRATDQQQACERLRAALRAQRLPLGSLARVRVLAGDLARPQLGLAASDYAALARNCGTIVHNGASVSLARGYASLRAVNVESTRTLLELARRASATLHYVSTLATALGAGAPGVIAERFVEHHAGLQDGYSQSKWASERLLEQAHAQGVAIKVYRLGRLVGALDSASVNRDDLVWRVVAAGLRAGALPRLGVREPWTPVDLIARIIVAACGERHDTGLYNLVPSELVELDDVMRWTASFGYRVALCAPDEFKTRLASNVRAIDPATLAMLETQAHRAIPGIEVIESGHTRALLARHGLSWPRLGERELHRYLTTCVAEGVLLAPSAGRDEAAQPA